MQTIQTCSMLYLKKGIRFPLVDMILVPTCRWVSTPSKNLKNDQSLGNISVPNLPANFRRIMCCLSMIDCVNTV